MHTIVRITTVPISLKVLLKGQLNFMQQNGFKVIAVSAYGKEVDELIQQENCDHFAIPFTRNISPIQDIICVIKLVKYLKKVKPTIVHTHTPKAGFIGMLAAYFARVPVRLHTIAGLPWSIENGLKKIILKTVEKTTVIASSKVYVNSKNLFLYLQNEKINSKKITFLGNGTTNGIDVNYFHTTTEIEQKAKELKQLNNVKQEAWVWLFVGRVVKDKGIQELLEAFCQLQKKYLHDQLWIVGEIENELDPLDEVFKIELNTNAQVKKFGFQKDVRPYYAAANMLVFPSYREGFPNVPMQAALMDCGLILSNINGCNEIVEHNKTGLLVEVQSAIDVLNKMFFARENKLLVNECKIVAKANIIKYYSQDVVWNNLLDEYKILIIHNNV